MCFVFWLAKIEDLKFKYEQRKRRLANKIRNLRIYLKEAASFEIEEINFDIMNSERKIKQIDYEIYMLRDQRPRKYFVLH